MSVVKINAIAVPEGMGPELERRFAERAKAVEAMPGFEGFELLRPTGEEQRYFVYTRWADEESFRGWVQSAEFQHGHARAESTDGKPVSHGASLLSFEVVLAVDPTS
jgi:heme-degrading monooxygenase HmoA